MCDTHFEWRWALNTYAENKRYVQRVRERLGGYNLFEKKKLWERSKEREKSRTLGNLHSIVAIFTLNSRHGCVCVSFFPVLLIMYLVFCALLSRALLLSLFMHRFISIQFKKLYADISITLYTCSYYARAIIAAIFFFSMCTILWMWANVSDRVCTYICMYSSCTNAKLMPIVLRQLQYTWDKIISIFINQSEKNTHRKMRRT